MQTSGTVKWFKRDQGLRVHSTRRRLEGTYSYTSPPWRRPACAGLYEGQRVSFTNERDRRGRFAAENLQVVE